MNGPLGIMFHHFHGAGHYSGQGSLSQQDLEAMLDHLAKRFELTPAREFLTLMERKQLDSRHICLTFDDSLRCQYDLALPILETHKLTAFWFVYTSPLEGNIERLEVYRYFRNSCFRNIGEFYRSFFNMAEKNLGSIVTDSLKNFTPENYLPDYPFYTNKDRTFRYLRDEVLNNKEYNGLMDQLLADSGKNFSAITESLWMRPKQLRNLHEAGHVIGMHSHSHPMNMERLSEAEQRREYQTNHRILMNILGVPPVAMSHPCNRYTSTTLDILSSLGIRLGFRADRAMADHSVLELPREDHANIIRNICR